MKDPVIIITEKPDAARRIADALSNGKKETKEENGVNWYKFKKDGKLFIVTCAVGHLFVLDTIKNRGGWTYPTFDVQWIPTHSKKGHEFSQKYFEVVEKLVKLGKDFIIATDYDTEGSVIGFNILRFLCNKKNAKRMKFSTLTKDELLTSFENVSPKLDFGQIEAGLTRHYLDFYWGINLTRALTLAMKNYAKRGFSILSTGRVQGPTLAMLWEKEQKIRRFKPTPFWQLELHLKVNGKKIIAHYEKDRILKKEIADKIIKGIKNKDAIVKNIKKRKYKQSPPVPFNTTDMQAEAYAQFKYSPRQTMSIAESLYQAGIISYPRSSSQKLPPKINYVKILKAIAKIPKYKKLAEELLSKEKLIPKEGKKTDPAHPAIYPTWEIPKLEKLTPQQKKLYDLVVRRFLSVFADVALKESITVALDVNGNKFLVSGKRTIEPGWTKFYSPYTSTEEQILPELKVGQKLKVIKVELLSKQTQPPGRYSQGSILKEMEKRNLGTKATRYEILQTLYDRRYIIGKSIQVTKLGETVTKVLKEFCPRILSEELTRKFENEMELVFNKKKKRDEVLEEAKKILTEILKDFKKNEKKIGRKLLKGLLEARKDENRIGVCPKCGGELRIIYSKSTHKRFVGCSNYPKCHNAYPLPQVGKITPLHKPCPICGLPMIQVWRKGKRPFRMCINPKCKSKENWGKKKDSKK